MPFKPFDKSSTTHAKGSKMPAAPAVKQGPMGKGKPAKSGPVAPPARKPGFMDNGF